MILFTSATVGIFGALIALVLVALIIIKRYRIAKPDEAIIVTGGKGKEVVDPTTGHKSRDLSGQKVVTGGGVFAVSYTHLDVYKRQIEGREALVHANRVIARENGDTRAEQNMLGAACDRGEHDLWARNGEIVAVMLAERDRVDTELILSLIHI